MGYLDVRRCGTLQDHQHIYICVSSQIHTLACDHQARMGASASHHKLAQKCFASMLTDCGCIFNISIHVYIVSTRPPSQVSYCEVAKIDWRCGLLLVPDHHDDFDVTEC